MAVTWDEINKVTIRTVLRDAESIQQAIRAMPTGEGMKLIVNRCQELGLEPAEMFQQAIDTEAQLFLKFRNGRKHGLRHLPR